MIGLTNAVLLASTKLKTRRVRTVLTIVLSGLLFAILVAALIFAKGAYVSIDQFRDKGLYKRYIVASFPAAPNAADGLTDPATIQRALDLYKETVAAKKAEAGRLGVPYDESSEPNPVATLLTQQGGVQEKQRLNLWSPIAMQALREYADAHPDPSLSDFKAAANPYSPEAFYVSTDSMIQDGALTTMFQGKEDLTAGENDAPTRDPLHTAIIEKIDSKLLQPYMFDSKTSRSAGEIPIVVTYSRAAALLGLPPLSNSATADQKMRQIKEIYSKAPTIRIEACYRNSVSVQQIRAAADQAGANANDGSNDKNSPVLYGLPPADSCGQAVVASDTRTAAEKKADDAQNEFDRKFGKTVDPVQQKLVFRVVGLLPDRGSTTSTTAGDILAQIVDSNSKDAIMIPADQFNGLPNAEATNSIFFSENVNPLAGSSDAYYAEFSNDADARKFIADKSCTTTANGRCATPERPFNLHTYGSNSIALGDMQHKFSRLFTIAALAISGIAVIIMSGTIGRMIADGRRETAIFRAIGAKKSDIAVIYSLYTFFLSFGVALFATVVGIAIAYGLDHVFWRDTTVQARLLFGAANTQLQFHFFAFSGLVGAVVLGVFICGFLGMIIPIVRNARRNPINDMRDE